MVRVESVRGEIRGAINIQIRYIKPECTYSVKNELMKNENNEYILNRYNSRTSTLEKKNKNVTSNISYSEK